ncbi:phosphoenolpyruvate synthase [Zobellia galactanivorans]|uniref:phosphoenolpyruvate synthase n=1 Tax=Zobellia galactanivorans (strain DSM 12802 / CCUG 47099 / CIP 106680 / NCIMB 13871 / Dsij) TaxID=63186 RepID=UPI001C066CCE|nr:phosphoenolpyruvate synthase [Zobellia galactanivorans]MBU3024510.1 phosphoenolpyruvate synthase [Zobellia galactanivorans]MDO6807613.1 phosphoenolpyruvate synthase [Zobellia galactanivorans]
MKNYIRHFNEIDINDVPTVGGKNASLGEMFQKLTSKGVQVPDGFATTAEAYWHFLQEVHIQDEIFGLLAKLNTKDFSNLKEIGASVRKAILGTELPEDIKEAIKEGYDSLAKKYKGDISLAVRSSATAEDLPNASFAGQQESYLNVKGKDELIDACKRCYASLFTDRAIKYREDNGFDHTKVALSIGVQMMVRSDLAASGVNFTLDPDTGFDQVVMVSCIYGLGENIVQGSINPDDYFVFKPSLKNGVEQPIVSRRLGSKEKTMVYDKSGSGTVNLDTPVEKQEQYVLTDAEVVKLAQWSLIIEDHYQRPMDIEWAKDGLTNELFIVQARPETVQSAKKNKLKINTYTLLNKGKEITRGMGLGNKISSGKARILHSPEESDKLQKGEILVTERTNPDWDPILKKAAGIITDQGGRTSHAAIVAREVGAAAIVGSNNATKVIKDGQDITISCAEGDTGIVYDGLLEWNENEVDIAALGNPKTQAMLILADPEQAFKYSFYPSAGVGLMRLEFVINNSIQIHPMALKHFDRLKDPAVKEKIQKLTHHYPDKSDYFVHKLAEGIATIAAAFYPKDVIVRTSDFKTNEYANLIGGTEFEPVESNPMLGFRGASRYYNPKYQDAFALECMALKRVRETMGLTNVKVMIPFCRTLKEAAKVVSVLEKNGLKRGENGLQLYMMTEIPNNIILAEQFAEYFDGFSIGSNDLTQLTLGVDRDSELLSDIFDINDIGVKKMIAMVIESAHKTHTKIGLCGQAPSDYPEFAQFLVEKGINSISFNPDALIAGIKNITKAEKNKIGYGMAQSSN